MPIPFTCPNCGKQMQVADQYAGQTGPCQQCGKPIAIPSLPSMTPGVVPASYQGYASAPPPKSGGGGTTLFVVLGVLAFFGVIAAGCVLALVIPAVGAVRGAAARAQSTNNLKQLGLAVHNYEATYGELPPAVVRDADGKPLYSGRVLLLPFLEQSALFNQWKKDEAWNGPTNGAISKTVLKVFMDPADQDQVTARTDYLFITGPGSVFEEVKDEKVTLGRITDGTSNTILMMEIKGAGVNWAEPQDIDINNVWPHKGHHKKGTLMLFADGSVRMMTDDLDPGTVREMATRNGGEIVNPYDY
jgi:hypothetical protein